MQTHTQTSIPISISANNLDGERKLPKASMHRCVMICKDHTYSRPEPDSELQPWSNEVALQVLQSPTVCKHINDVDAFRPNTL